MGPFCHRDLTAPDGTVDGCTVKSAFPNPRVQGTSSHWSQSRGYTAQNPMLPPIRARPPVARRQQALSDKAVTTYSGTATCHRAIVSVRIFDADHSPARLYVYHLPGSMTEMPGENVTPHNPLTFPAVVGAFGWSSLSRCCTVVQHWTHG